MNKISKVLVATTMAASILMTGTGFSKVTQVSADTLSSDYIQLQDISETYLNVSEIIEALSKPYSHLLHVQKNNDLGNTYGYDLTVNFKDLTTNYKVTDFTGKDPVSSLLAKIIEDKNDFKEVVGDNGLLTLSSTTEVDANQYLNTSFMVGQEDVLDYDSLDSNNPMEHYTPKYTGKFTDVTDSNHWSYQHIYNLVALGVTNGSGNKFLPGDNITRGQFSAMLARTIPNTGLIYDTTVFTDVSDSQFKVDIQKLNEMGVVGGIGNGKFAPKDKITRQQASAMIIRYLDAMGIDTSDIKTTTPFADSNKFSDYGKDAIGKLYNLGVISGKTEGGKLVFAPNDKLTRAQMAKILDNTLKLIVNTENNKVQGVITKNTFANCTELNVVYPEGVSDKHVAYNANMDRDKDGWACEVDSDASSDSDSE